MSDTERILESIRRSTVAVVHDIDPASVIPERTLAELGCNSLDRVDIITLTMEDLGARVPVSDFRQDQTIRDVIAVLGRPR